MQVWVGITTVIAGLLSIPSVLIAQAALTISEHQQRQQEQQQKLAQAESEKAAQEAYVQRITTWTEHSATDGKPDRIIIQNANALPAQAWIIRQPARELPRDIRPINLAPCSRVTVADVPPPRWSDVSDFGSQVIARNVHRSELYHIRDMGRRADRVVSDHEAWGDWGIMIMALDPIDTPEEKLKGIERRPKIVDERPAGRCV